MSMVSCNKGRYVLTNELDPGRGLAQLVGGPAGVVAVLVLFDGDHPQGGVGELVGRGELRHAVVAVVRDRLLPATEELY